MEILIILVLWGFCGFFGMMICRDKGRDPGLGLALGLLLGIIGVFIAMVLSRGDGTSTQRVYYPGTGEVKDETVWQCPSCSATLQHTAVRCWRCNVLLPPDHPRWGATPVPPRPCPFCRAEIDGAAKKCRHCGEWVVPEADRAL